MLCGALYAYVLVQGTTYIRTYKVLVCCMGRYRSRYIHVYVCMYVCICIQHVCFLCFTLSFDTVCGDETFVCMSLCTGSEDN